MIRLACKLLQLVAMLLMPLAMAPAPAHAPNHRGSMAAMPMQHCPDEQQAPSGKARIAECEMICAAALPAPDLEPAGQLLIRCEPAHPAAAQRLHGLEPEIATPPPKRS